MDGSHAVALAVDVANLVDRWQDLGPTLWVAAGVAAALWFVAFGVLAAATNPLPVRPGPGTLDLGGPESPAVVNLLTSDWKLDHVALPATLLDLAARGHLAIDQVGEDTLVRVRTHGAAARSGSAPLTDYESMVLDHVTHLASHADDGVVPAQALTTGPDEHAKRWWKRFEKAVASDARSRGLSRSRWSGWMMATLTVGALAVAIAVALAVSATWREDDEGASEEETDPVTSSLGGAFFTFAGLMAMVGATAEERDTKAGRAAAARWLGFRDLLATDTLFAEQPPAGVAIWDRHLAYGASVGIAHGAVRAIPFGTDRPDEAWSPVTGRWRLVHIRYPRRLPPRYGNHPLKVATIGLFQTAVAAVALRALPELPDLLHDAAVDLAADDSTSQLLDTVGVVVVVGLTAVMGAIALRALVMLGCGILDLAHGRRTVEGRVVRRAPYCLAVDDGSSDRIRAWRLASTSPMTEGSTVRGELTRYLAHVKSLELVSRGTTLAPDIAEANPA